jgi:hypothetical protein
MTPTRWIWIAAVIAALAGEAAAQPDADPGPGSGSGSAVIDLPVDVNAPQVNAAAAPSEVRLGDPFTLFINVTYDPNVTTINLVEPIDLGPGFEVGRREGEDKKLPDGRVVRSFQIEVRAWELGQPLMIPPQTVTFTAMGNSGQVQSNPVPINVMGVLGDIVDDPKLVRGLAPPHRAMKRDWFLLIVIAAVIGALAAIIALLVWRRRKARRMLGTSWVDMRLPMRIEAAAEEALRRLTELEQSGRIDDDAKRPESYREMADIMRVYLGRRVGFHHHDLTTSEILARVRRAPELAEAATDFGRWLDGCDLVKFAAYPATREEGYDALRAGRDLVLRIATRPRSSKEMAAVPPPPTTTDAAPTEAASGG